MLVTDAARARALAASLRRVAVFGARPLTKLDRPAAYVPAFLVERGVHVIPVPDPEPEPGGYPGGEPATLASLPPGLDAIIFFKRPADLPPAAAVVAARPRIAWLQEGIRELNWEAAVAAGGIEVVADRCVKKDRAAADAAGGGSPRL